MKAAEILAAAAALVDGDRASSHGPKLRNHQNIATLWGAWLQVRRDPAAPLTPADAAAMMVLLKLARSQLSGDGSRNVDDALDAAAYAAIFGELDE
jgi:Domain of unknown function (DUF6378)